MVFIYWLASLLEDGGQSSRRWDVGGGGGEWVAGFSFGQAKLLFEPVMPSRSGDLLNLYALSSSFQIFLWCSVVSSGGALILLCFSRHLPNGSSSVFWCIFLWCPRSGDKLQSTWRLFGRKF